MTVATRTVTSSKTLSHSVITQAPSRETVVSYRSASLSIDLSSRQVVLGAATWRGRSVLSLAFARWCGRCGTWRGDV